MELSVGNAANAHPTNDDIEQAIDESQKAADWHLNLQSNGDDCIEAFADAVTSGRDPSPSGEDGLRSVELTAAIADSVRQGRVISLAAG